MKIIDITPQAECQRQKIRLAGYCRVSTKSEDQEHSLAAQILYFTNYTKEHPEYELVDVYADEGITGTDMEKRDDLNRLLRDCRMGKIDRIVCKSLSRFARNTEELLHMMRMLKEFGVSIYFEDKDIDSDKLNSEMFVTFPGIAAQQESEAISGNVRWSIQKRMKSGDYNCTFAAYGFDRKNEELIVKEDEAEVVRKIFHMYLQGEGLQAIANKLNAEGVPRRYGYTVWHQTAVRYILTNERYKGDALLQKQYRTEVLPRKQKRNKREKKQYYVVNANPPIVSRETFDTAQVLLNSRKGNTPRGKKSPFSGKLRCPDCGGAFRRQLLRGKIYWHCENRASMKTQCQSRRVREDAVQEAFIDMLYKLKTYRKEVLGDLIGQMDQLQSEQIQNQGIVGKIDKEIADLSAKNLVMTRLHVNGALSDADYAQKFAEINNRLTELRKERRWQLTNEEDKQLSVLKDLNDIISEYEPSSQFDGDLFDQIVERVVVDSNAQITFCLCGDLHLTETIPEKRRCFHFEEQEDSLRLCL